jgi:hypothetical protein
MRLPILEFAERASSSTSGALEGILHHSAWLGA